MECEKVKDCLKYFHFSCGLDKGAKFILSAEGNSVICWKHGHQNPEWVKQRKTLLILTYNANKPLFSYLSCSNDDDVSVVTLSDEDEPDLEANEQAQEEDHLFVYNAEEIMDLSVR